MEYLVFAIVLAAVLIGVITFRNRSTRNPSKSVDSFSRAREALKPRKTKKRVR